jgi:hypothetical protein
MDEQTKQVRWVTSIAVVGSVLTGFAALFGAVLTFMGQDFTGFGTCLLAAAVAFGLMAHVLLRQ